MPPAAPVGTPALVGEYLIEELAHVPVEVEYASEFRYRNAPLETNTLSSAITQSGETADTLAALARIQAPRPHGAGHLQRRRQHASPANPTAASICTPARKSASPRPKRSRPRSRCLRCWPCSWAAFAPSRCAKAAASLHALEAIPQQMEAVLAQNDAIQRIALKYAQAEDFLFLGRQYNFPVALEGALKLKEISYIHAEGYPAAEMKHGPIALIDQRTPTVFVVPADSLLRKNLQQLGGDQSPPRADHCPRHRRQHRVSRQSR